MMHYNKSWGYTPAARRFSIPRWFSPLLHRIFIMTFLISATFVLSVIYFAIALIAFVHDRLAIRSNCPDTDIPTLVATLDAEPALDENLGPEEELAIAVPEKKADLIKFIREHKLQSAVYELTGASYSNAKVNKLPVLRNAVLTAIA